MERVFMHDQIDRIGREAIDYFTLKHAARERALPKSRATIRLCANSIRATHRHDMGKAYELIAQAGALLSEMEEDLRDHRDIYYAGFVQDAQKEYAEAVTFAALVEHQPLPTPGELAIGYAAFLNGIAEAVGELRRYVLDQLRRGNVENCEVFLSYMDDIYAVLISVDFPDAITSGLRRSTDAARGILEKTRGDLTSAFVQLQLQRSMRELQEGLQNYPPVDQKG
jgi:translin